VKFTVTIEVPEGATIAVSPSVPVYDPSPAGFVPPFEDELIPLPPEAIPVQGDPPHPSNWEALRGIPAKDDPAAFRAPQARQAETAPRLCPTHHEPWKLVPEGVSKKTGRPYSAFYACPVRGCDQRPAA